MLLISACSQPQSANAKPSAPILIEYSVPKTIEPNIPVITVIKFISERDLKSLKVQALAYSGIKLESAKEPVKFISVLTGDYREVQVTVRLLDEVGYLSVFATTTDLQGRTKSKSILIKYGTATKTTIEKMKSPDLKEDSEGRKVILMPATIKQK